MNQLPWLEVTLRNSSVHVINKLCIFNFSIKIHKVLITLFLKYRCGTKGEKQVNHKQPEGNELIPPKCSSSKDWEATSSPRQYSACWCQWKLRSPQQDGLICALRLNQWKKQCGSRKRQNYNYCPWGDQQTQEWAWKGEEGKAGGWEHPQAN